MTPIAMQAYPWWTQIFVWVMAVLAGLLVCLFGLYFFAAFFAKQRVRRPIPVEGRSPVHGDDVVAQAEALGFRDVGTFSDGDKGVFEMIATFMLSADGAELLWVVRSKLAGRHQLISRLADDTWIVTSSVPDMSDLSGMRREETLRGATLGTMLHYHRSRLEALAQTAVPFDAADVLDDWVADARRRADATIAIGLGRLRKPDPATGKGGQTSESILCWSYSCRGAARVVAALLRDLGRATRETKQAEIAADNAVRKSWGIK